MTHASRVRPTLAALCIGALCMTTARSGSAAPQWNAGAVVGAAGQGSGVSYWNTTRFYLGARGDVLFGQNRSGERGYGPFVDVGTAGFSDARLCAGASALLPFVPSVPIVVSLGPLLVVDGAQTEGGIGARLFIGPREYNHVARYSIAGGLALGLDVGLGAPQSRLLTLSAQLDAVLLALPAVALASWVSGGSGSP